jgi:hypothetical protein
VDLAVPVGLAVRVGPVIPVGPAARVGPVPITPAVRVGRAAPVDRVDRMDRGMEMPNAATSTAPRGATAPGPGGRVHHLARRGIDRSPRPVDIGVMARSTTGATRKRPTGTPCSTSGDLTSSGSGFRCKDRSTRRPLRQLARRASLFGCARLSYLPGDRTCGQPLEDQPPTRRLVWLLGLVGLLTLATGPSDMP